MYLQRWFNKASKVFKEVLRIFQRKFTGISSKEFTGHFKGFSGVFQRNSKGDLRKIEWCLKGFLRVFQGYSKKGVARKCRGCFKEN